MKFYTMAVFTILIVSAPLRAEQITKIAVLDYQRVLTAFYADSGEIRRIEAMKTEFAAEVRRLQEEIQSLEERKLDAVNRGDSRIALELDTRIEEKKQYYQEYVRIKGNSIQTAQANLGSGNAMAREILDTIRFVAENNGFSLILKKSDPNLLWWSYEIDITDLVLKQLMNNE